jgi:polyether ionophore transport system permease protein
MTRLLVRRYRLVLTAWLLLLITLCTVTVSAYRTTYATGELRRAAVLKAQQDPATTLVYGLLPDPGTANQMYAWEIGTFATILAAVLGVLIAVALTRAIEDDGTLELFRSCGLAPGQPLRSALLVLLGCAVVADTRDIGRLNWLSPLGLRAVVQPYTTDRWWALLPALLAAAAAAAGAIVLSARREFGAGFIRRRDIHRGRLRVRSATGLAFRLARGSLVIWTVAVAAIGTLFAAMGSGTVRQRREAEVGGFLGAQLGDGDPAAGYLSYCGTIVGIIICVYAVLSASDSRRAERRGLTDLQLTTGVRRWSPLAAQATVTAAGAAVVLAVTGALTALIAPAVLTGDDVAARAFVYLIGQWPAAAAMTGCTVLLAGVLPRLTALAWLPLIASTALALLGDLLKVPARVQDLGLFKHVPDVAAAGPSTVALILLTGLGVGLSLAGLVGVTRRDLLVG